MCQHGLTIETAQDNGFNLSILNTACWILNRGTASTIQSDPAIWTEVKERLEVIRDGNSRSSKVEYVNLPLYLTCKFWLYCVAACVFKTDRSNCMGFEWSFTTIWPKLLMYQRFKFCVPAPISSLRMQKFCITCTHPFSFHEHMSYIFFPDGFDFMYSFYVQYPHPSTCACPGWLIWSIR